MCTPAPAVRDVTFSDIELDQRTWSARIAVDAARCATTSGRFNIRFVRLKEEAPDENFRSAPCSRFTAMSSVKSSVTRAKDRKPHEPVTRDDLDLLATLPPKKAAWPSVRQRQRLSRQRSA
jgi:hypothetical protein